MGRLEKCTQEWQNHLQENKLLLLYMDDKIKRTLQNPIFTEVREGKNEYGLMIFFKSEVVENGLLMIWSPSSGWGSMVESKKMEVHYAIGKESVVSVLLDAFDWRKYT